MAYDRIPGVDENFRLPPEVMDTILPPGSFIMYGGDVAPAGFALAQGQEVSRTGDYARVFDALGIKYGDGDGSTTFNLPDLRGKIVVGYDVSQVEFNTMGKTGGTKEVTLTTAEMPSHRHSGMGIVGVSNPGGGTAANVQGGGTYSFFFANSGAEPLSGGGEAHENMPPYVTGNYLIKL